MRARYPGFCRRGGHAIRVGEDIGRDGRNGWAHGYCLMSKPDPGPRRPRRVGPNEVPTVEDYSHWNEEAAQVWWLENRYDMMYPGGE